MTHITLSSHSTGGTLAGLGADKYNAVQMMPGQGSAEQRRASPVKSRWQGPKEQMIT